MQAMIAPSPIPFGAKYLENNLTQFCVYVGPEATEVRVCLFPVMEQSIADREILMSETASVPWEGARGRIHHVTVENCRPGQLYGFRVCGPWDPRNGLRYRDDFILMDPWTTAVGRRARWDAAIFGFNHSSGNDLERGIQSNAAFCPLSVVMNGDGFDWQDDQRPNIPWADTVLYETHVRGLTKTHQLIEPPFRGTFSGLCSPVVINHLKRLGVTALELMPIQTALPETLNRGEYWRYNTMAHFAPEAEYSAYRDPLARSWELKRCVKQLHAAGIEVILDVVFNHTAEGSELGPTLSLRGLANGEYYRLAGTPEGGPYRYYDDHTGCGNTLNFDNPIVVRYVLDCLRHWADTYHVDGFRFDLATVLGFHVNEFRSDSPFLTALAADSLLSKLKLIAEPWDTRRYHLGGFPKPWREWNDKYRDFVRRYWRGDHGVLSNFATAFAGSVRDLYPLEHRAANTSINFVTSHDGFTLNDLVSYPRKHNVGNGEGDRDGAFENYSSGYGAEGPTNDLAINELRQKQCRNLIATLALSHGVPMYLGGDELLRTQQGNNNAYCHDSPLTWLDWSNVPRRMLRFFQRLARMRKLYPQIRNYLSQTPYPENEKLSWVTLDGAEMCEDLWKDANRRAVAIHWRTTAAKKVSEIFLLFNADPEAAAIASLPTPLLERRPWCRVLDTGKHQCFRKANVSLNYQLEPRSLAMFVV